MLFFQNYDIFCPEVNECGLFFNERPQPCLTSRTIEYEWQNQPGTRSLRPEAYFMKVVSVIFSQIPLPKFRDRNDGAFGWMDRYRTWLAALTYRRK